MSNWQFDCVECKINFIKKKRIYKICPKFCSRNCYKKNKLKNSQYVEFNCVSCGKPVQAHRSKKVLLKGNPRFCSYKCRGSTKKFQWKTATSEQIKDVVSKSFEKNVVKTEGCWGWIGRFDKDGYSILSLGDQRFTRAHRVSWYLKYGNLPIGTCAHTCDQKFCCNPEHIFCTDAKGNASDLVQKGLQKKGEESETSKLKEKEVKEIKSSNSKVGELAEKYKVSNATIYRILSGKTWAHIK